MLKIQKKSFRGLAVSSVLVLALLFVVGCNREPLSDVGPDMSLADAEQKLVFERQLKYMQAHEDMVEADMSSPFSSASVDPAKKAGASDKWLALMRDLDANTIGFAVDGPQGELEFSTAKDATIHIVQNTETGKLELMKFDPRSVPFFHGILVPCHDGSAQKSLCTSKEAEGQSTRSAWDSPRTPHYHYAVINSENRRYNISNAPGIITIGEVDKHLRKKSSNT